LSDSALDIARGLLDEAWGGKSPDGGLDFPSACVLSKSSDLGSDLHLDFGVVQGTEQLSEVPWLADVTHTDVHGPSDSDAPFRYQTGELVPPGMFGKALRAYGQVMALAGEYAVPTEGYDSWFREQWGVDPDADLALAIPMVRSHGDSLWGGINRKLSPYAGAHSAASKQVKLAWHGRGRKDMGEHAVVSWPRLSAIAQIAGGALMVEDRRAAGRLKRIDFRVVRSEIPKAPKHLGQGLGRIAVRSGWATRDVSNGAIEFVQGFRKTALTLARGGLGPSEALNVDPGVDVPAAAVLRYLQETAVPGVPHVNFLEMGEAVFDIEPVPVKQKLDVPGGERMNVYNAFAAVIRPYVDRHYAELPTSATVRDAIDTVKEVPMADSSQAVLRRVIGVCVPDDFLLRMYRLYTVAHRDAERGNEIVSTVLRTFDAPRSVFETRDWVAVGRRVKSAVKCRDWLAEEIARSINRHLHEHGTESPAVGKLRRILSSEGTGDIAIAEIVRQRRNWWSQEYRRRAKDRPGRRVEYQIRGRLFREVRIDVQAGGSVVATRTSPQLVGALTGIARAYLRKRKKRGAADPDPPDPGRSDLLEYASILDETLVPDYPFVEGVVQFTRSVSMLEQDVIRIMAYISDNMPRWDDTGGLELEDDESAPDDASVVSEPTLDRGAAEGEVEEAALFGEDDDDDDVGEVGGEQQSGFVRLADELSEDYPALEFTDIARAVATHGEYVYAAEYKEIGAAVHAVYLARVGVVGGAGDLSGADITDIR